MRTAFCLTDTTHLCPSERVCAVGVPNRTPCAPAAPGPYPWPSGVCRLLGISSPKCSKNSKRCPLASRGQRYILCRVVPPAGRGSSPLPSRAQTGLHNGIFANSLGRYLLKKECRAILGLNNNPVQSPCFIQRRLQRSYWWPGRYPSSTIPALDKEAVGRAEIYSRHRLGGRYHVDMSETFILKKTNALS